MTARHPASPNTGALGMVLMLGVVAAFQQADKVMFSMSMEPIKRDLGLSDTQLGLLNGLAFALFFAVASLPLARISDRHPRRNVIAACLLAWSAFTALTSLATSFAGLFAARLLVGVGEAGSQPASLSLVAARFEPAKRAGATALLLSGGYLGIVVGLWGAGLAIDGLGWRHAFLLFGLPGIGFAILFRTFVPEPAERGRGEPSSLADIMRFAQRRTVQHLFAFFSLAWLVSYGVLGWAPAYYERRFGLTSAEAGLWLGVAIGLGTVIGAVLGGWLSNKMAARHSEGGMRLAFATLALNAPLAIGPFLVADRAVSIALLMAGTITGGACVGPFWAALQSLAEPRARATAIAAFSAGTVIIGQGLGPVVVGTLSDLIAPRAGSASLQVSLVVVTTLAFWPLFHAWRVVRNYSEDHARLSDNANLS